MPSDPSRSCHCFVITLDHSQARRDLISARLAELGIPFEFYPGVDGRKIDLLAHPNYSKWKRRMFFGRDLSKGEFGCVLAHQSLYEHIVANHIGAALILEDDAILSDELPAVINALTHHPKNWDLVRFLGRKKTIGLHEKLRRCLERKALLPGRTAHLEAPMDTSSAIRPPAGCFP